MPLSPEEMDRKIEEHFRYEAEDDVEGVLGSLAPGARHDVVGWPAGPQRGHEKIRPFYERMFADIAGESVEPIRRFHGDRFVVDESLWKGKAPGRPFGFEGKGRRLEFRLLHLFEFNDDGQIAGEQVWVDMAAIAKQLD